MKAEYTLKSWKWNISIPKMARVLSKYFKVRMIQFNGKDSSYDMYKVIVVFNNIPSNIEDIEETVRKELNCHFDCFKIEIPEKESKKLRVLESTIGEKKE